MLEKMVLEQFTEGLPDQTSVWVWYHQPAMLDVATTLRPFPAQIPATTSIAPNLLECLGRSVGSAGSPDTFVKHVLSWQVIRVAGAATSSLDSGATYRIPVRIQGGVHRAMVDSGCMHSMIHQNLVLPGALVEACWVKIKCVHGDIHKYPLVTVEIRHKGKSIKSRSRLAPA